MYVSEGYAYALWEQQCYNLKSINNVKTYNIVHLSFCILSVYLDRKRYCAFMFDV